MQRELSVNYVDAVQLDLQRVGSCSKKEDPLITIRSCCRHLEHEIIVPDKKESYQIEQEEMCEKD